jgi:hypothetical protein
MDGAETKDLAFSEIRTFVQEFCPVFVSLRR